MAPFERPFIVNCRFEQHQTGRHNYTTLDYKLKIPLIKTFWLCYMKFSDINHYEAHLVIKSFNP